MLQFSYFNHFFDNAPQMCNVADWNAFVDTMKQISDVPGYKPPMGDYDNQQALLSPAIYLDEEGIKRCNKNVLGWDIVMMDIDDTELTIEEIQERFKLFNYIIYSSPSCTMTKLKIRVVIPLHKRAPANILHGIWYAVQQWCEGMVDEQTKDPARFFYIPARYTNKGDEYRHFFHINKGIDLNWEQITKKWPAPPEADRFKKDNPLKKLKRSIFVDNNPLPDFNIQSPNCAFVYDAMIQEYQLALPGTHHLAIYRFMVKVCYNAMKINYPITLEEVADMGKQMDDLDGGFYDMKKMLDSASDAMEYTGA